MSSNHIAHGLKIKQHVENSMYQIKPVKGICSAAIHVLEHHARRAVKMWRLID